MRMKQAVTAASLVLSSAAAMAGLVQITPVSVTVNGDGSGSAIGNMAAARFSANTVEYIGCGVRVIDTGTPFVFAFCQAATATDVQGFCSTEDPDLVNAIHSISDYSFVTFSWDSDGICRSVGNSTQSFYIPDVKGK